MIITAGYHSIITIILVKRDYKSQILLRCFCKDVGFLLQSLKKISFKKIKMDSFHNNPDIIPTGSLALDYALGQGGLPGGCFIELRGPQSSGKTTLCLHTIAEAQKLGGVCAIIDCDYGITPNYPRQCGVNPNHLYVTQPTTAEQAFFILETLVCSGAFKLVVLDSVTALISAKELDAPLWRRDHDKTRDQLISRSLNKLSNVLAKTNTSIVFTNKNRQQISTIYHGLSENPSRMALGLHSKIRIDLRAGEIHYQQRKPIGRKIFVKITKNTISPQFYSTEFDIIMYNKGLDKLGEIIELGIRLKFINKVNSGWKYRGMILGRNREEAMQYLKMHEYLASELEKRIRQKLFAPAHWSEMVINRKLFEREFDN